jgi:hypothetical protein
MKTEREFKIGDQVQRKHDPSQKVGTIESFGHSFNKIKVRWNMTKHSTKVFSFNIKHYKP